MREQAGSWIVTAQKHTPPKESVSVENLPVSTRVVAKRRQKIDLRGASAALLRWRDSMLSRSLATAGVPGGVSALLIEILLLFVCNGKEIEGPLEQPP